MTSKIGENTCQTIWNKTPQKRLKQIHDYIKYRKLEPLSAERLTEELIDFGERLSIAPYRCKVIKELSNERFEYRTATYKSVYRFIFRINEKRKHLVITNLFHNSRHPNKLKKY